MSNRILVVDDEKHIRRMMRYTLEAAGYEVEEAPDGTQALELFGDGSKWEVVILDQRMPGIDGLETLRLIRERNPRARIVMATAYASIELAVNAMKLGAADFVRKPLTPETLRNAVAAALARRAAADRKAVAPKESETVDIETITMNGFAITDVAESISATQKRFIVIDPTGPQHEVVVEITEDLLAYVQRMIRKSLPPENSFWTSQARLLLSNYLWENSKLPKVNRLTLDEIDRSELSVASKWISS